MKRIESGMASVYPDRDGNIRGGRETERHVKISLVVVSVVSIAVFIAFCTVLGLFIKEKIGKENYHCDGGNCKEEVEPLESCTGLGYKSDPVLGCYHVLKSFYGPKAFAREHCSKYGGRILLVNSALEASVALSIIINESLPLIWIQGTRSSVSSPWLTEDGDDLPYIGPHYRELNDDPKYQPLELSFNENYTFQALSPRRIGVVFCVK